MSPFLLRGPLVHPRPDLRYLGVDIFERIAQRSQRFEQVVPVKAPEVGGAGVPAVLKEGQSGPHPGGPLRPAGSVAGSRLNVPDMPGKDMEPPVEISLCASRQPALDIIATRKAPFGATSVRAWLWRSKRLWLP